MKMIIIIYFQLARPLMFSSSVRPIGAPRYDTPAGTTATASGWGASDYESINKYNSPSKLLKINMKIVSNEECSRSHVYQIFTEQICGFTARGQGMCIVSLLNYYINIKYILKYTNDGYYHHRVIVVVHWLLVINLLELYLGENHVVELQIFLPVSTGWFIWLIKFLVI